MRARGAERVTAAYEHGATDLEIWGCKRGAALEAHLKDCNRAARIILSQQTVIGEDVLGVSKLLQLGRVKSCVRA